MFSGGLDSTMLLVETLKRSGHDQVHVHHIRWMNSEGRMQAEDRAVLQIVPYCRSKYRGFAYSESLLDFRSLALIPDYQVIAFIASMIAMKLRYEKVSSAWLATDDQAKRLKQLALYERLAAENKLHTRLVYPIVHTTKADALRALPKELIDMTWSCRRPTETRPCGACITCVSMKQAKEEAWK